MLAEILWNKDANTETARFKKLNDTPFKGRSSKDQPSFATETSSTPTPIEYSTMTVHVQISFGRLCGYYISYMELGDKKIEHRENKGLVGKNGSKTMG